MTRVLLILLLAAGSCLGDEVPGYGADAYAVCSACHLATGEGIPGAFPPLRNRAAKIATLEGGRDYLISVVSSGLMGAMQADGMTYAGVMPGHQGSMSKQQIADALNYVVFELADETAEPTAFTAEEVGARQDAVDGPSPAVAQAMRGVLMEKHGDEWPQ